MQQAEEPTAEAVPVEVPNPIDEDGNIIVKYDQINDVVIMPSWYWLKIVNYIIFTQQ